MSSEIQCVLTEVTCRRAVYCMRGYSQSKNECNLFFWEPEKKLVIKPTCVKWEGGFFVLYINTETADGEYPLKSGKYVLMSGDESEPKPVRPSELPGVLQEDQADISIYKNQFHYLICRSGCDQRKESFFLDVDAALPMKRKYYKNGEVKKYGFYLKDSLKDLAESVFKSTFRCLKCFIRRDGKTILFTSGSRAVLGGNEECIYRRMVERGLDKEYTILFDFKESIRIRKTLPAMLSFLCKLARADIVVVDDYYPEICMLEFDRDVKVFQVWHACGAFKTVGLERMDKKGAPPINSKAHKCYTHVPVSSEHAALHYQECFGIDYSKIYPVGVPRTDIFFDQDYKVRIRKQLYRQFPQAEKARKTFLYAPTFRGNNALDASFPMDSFDLERWGRLCKKMGDYLIVKMHPFVKDKISIPDDFQDVIIDASEYREVNDLLFITDVLITDYSSVIYEFSLLRRPSLMYAFDLEEYEADRDFYEEYKDTVPGPVIKNFDKLLEKIEKDSYDIEELERFIKKNFTYTNGHSTDRVIDLMIGKTFTREYN